MTWVAVLFAVVVVGAALWFSVRGQKKPAAPSDIVAETPWYPEPSFLLDHASDLKLTVEQVRHVRIAARTWNLQKAAFDGQLKSYNSDTQSALADLKAGKHPAGNYGKLVDSFNQARIKAWTSATSTLKPEQVLRLDKLRGKEQPNNRSAIREHDIQIPQDNFGLWDEAEEKRLEIASAKAVALDREANLIKDQINRARRIGDTRQLSKLEKKLSDVHAQKAVMAKRWQNEYDLTRVADVKPGPHLIPLSPFGIKPILIPPAKPHGDYGRLASPGSKKFAQRDLQLKLDQVRLDWELTVKKMGKNSELAKQLEAKAQQLKEELAKLREKPETDENPGPVKPSRSDFTTIPSPDPKVNYGHLAFPVEAASSKK